MTLSHVRSSAAASGWTRFTGFGFFGVDERGAEGPACMGILWKLMARAARIMGFFL